MYDDFQLVGHVVTRVVLVWSVAGPFWRRHPVRPVELVEWRLTPRRRNRGGTVHTGPSRCGHVEDGVVFDTDTQLGEWDQGWWVRRGKMLRLTWLPPPGGSSPVLLP